MGKGIPAAILAKMGVSSRGRGAPLVIPLKGDASDRRYYRIKWEGDEGASLILMELDQRPSPPNLPFIQVQEHLASLNIPVPQIYGYYPEWGYLILEDLGETTLEDKVKDPKTEPLEVERLYREAIDILLTMQIYGSQPGGSPDCPAFTTIFDETKFMYELDFFLHYMIEGLLARSLEPRDRSLLREQFYQLAKTLARRKRYFTHRDYHSRNIMVKEGGLGILDFQDARMALCQYDLASLLRDSYVSLPEDLVEELIDYYLDQKERLEGYRQEGPREFREIFDLTCLQRNLKALGTFAFQKVAKNNPTYLPYVRPTLEYIWLNLEKYASLQPLKRTLGKYIGPNCFRYH